MATALNVPASYLNSAFDTREVKALQQYLKVITDQLAAKNASQDAAIAALDARVTALEALP